MTLVGTQRTVKAEDPPLTPELARLIVTTIRMLAVDAVEAAQSGHPGLPMGAADHAFVLWSRFLRLDPGDPAWRDRDRFVLSAGHGSMLLYALLHLSGFDLPLEEIRRFRQLGSRTPGHPEYGLTAGVETTTGPLGQGFGNGVGMALAARRLAALVNTPDFAPVSHRVFALVSDGDLMEGVSGEAASLAGHWRLGNLVYVYDDNRITIDGPTDLAFSERVPDRFRAYGWHVQVVDGHDPLHVEAALRQALAERERPSLICARTHIGYGSPHKQDTAAAHGAPLGPEEVKATKQRFGWPLSPPFYVPEEVRAWFRAWAERRREERRQWEEQYRAWAARHPEKAQLYEAFHRRELPPELEAQLFAAVTDEGLPTRKHSARALRRAAALIPALWGGAADLTDSTGTAVPDGGDFSAANPAGRTVRFGVREHAMGTILNGMALHGTAIPYGGTFLVFSDYMRPPMRMAALMGLQVIYVFTHDSIFVGEDGPTHQPVEQLAALRSIPNLLVLRPADGPETAAAWALALRRRDGPTALILTRQPVPPLKRSRPLTMEAFARGGYVLEEAAAPEVVLIGTGSETPVVQQAAALIRRRTGRAVQVVSMPAPTLFAEQPRAYREEVLPPGVPAAVVEAACSFGWHRIVGRNAFFVSVEQFGLSAPWQDLQRHFGLTSEQVADKVSRWLAGETEGA